MADESNNASPLSESMKKAFEFAADLTKQLITLATAIIGLTITFSKDFLGKTPTSARSLAYWAWYCFLASVALGVLTLSALTGNLAARDQTKPPTIYSTNITVFSTLQFLMFGSGLLLTVIFAVRSF